MWVLGAHRGTPAPEGSDDDDAPDDPVLRRGPRRSVFFLGNKPESIQIDPNFKNTHGKLLSRKMAK